MINNSCNTQGINMSLNDKNNYNYQNNINLLVQHQKQHNYLKSSISTPNMHLNNSHSYLYNNLNDKSLNPTNNFDITNGSINPSMISSLNRINQTPLTTTGSTTITTSITNDDLINNYEQLLNLYNVQIKKLQLQLLQQQKQMELTSMTDSPLMGLGQDNFNLLSNPSSNLTNNIRTPNFYNTADPSHYTTSLGNNILNCHNGYTYNKNNNNHNNHNNNNNNNLGVNPSFDLNTTTNATHPILNQAITTTMNNLLNLNAHQTSISSSQPSINANIINVDSLNNTSNSNVNYFQNSNMNYSNGPVSSNLLSSYYSNVGQTMTTKANGLNPSSLPNNIPTTTIDLAVTSIPQTNTLDRSELNQKRKSLTMNQFNANTFASENSNSNVFTSKNLNISNNLNPPLNINGINTVADVPNVAKDPNDYSINNAKNLFFEVIKDFNNNEIQDIVHSTMDYNKIDYY